MTIARISPQLRFPEFTDDWQTRKLGDIGDTVNGLTYSPADIRDEGVLVLRSSNIKNGVLDFRDRVYVNAEGLRFNESKQGDILICVRNGSTRLIGKNVYIDQEIKNTTHGAFMSVYRSEYNRFIKQLFDTSRYYKQVGADLGARINSINNSQLLKYKFNFPPKPEQEKIAEFLTAVDERVALQDKKVELLQKYKKSVMQKIFSQKIRFKDESNNTYPEWENNKLGNITDIIVGGTPSTGKHEYWDGNIGWLASGDIGNKYVSKPSKYISALGLEKSAAKLMPEHTILLAMTGATLGKIGYLTFECAGNQSVAGFMPNSRFIPAFLYFNLYLMQNQISSLSAGAAQAGISKGSMSDLTLSLPCLEEQQKIVDLLTVLDNKANLEKAKLTEAKKFKKGLLQRMFV